MRLALVQYNPVWENKQANIEKIKHMTEDLPGTELLVFPEMTLTGFTMNAGDHAEDFEGQTCSSFASLARERRCAVVFGMIEKGRKRNFNTLVHMNSRGRIMDFYRKIHPFSYSNEHIHFGRGRGIVISRIKGLKTGFSICYDLRFPELYRLYAKKGVQLILNIANWPDTRIEHWRALLKARAIENQCFTAGVNRVGDDPKLHYSGYSSIYDPMGNEIASAGDEEKIITAEIDKKYVSEVRKRLPFLTDIKLI